MSQLFQDFVNRDTSSFTPSEQVALGRSGQFGFLPDGAFSVGGTARSLIAGFTQGFTGFNIMQHDPQNAVEALAGSIGGVAGFLGFVPNPVGIGGRFAASALGRSFGLSRLASQASKPLFPVVGSIPLHVSDMIIKGATAAAKKSAYIDSLRLIKNPALAAKISDASFEAARLGIASGLAAPWTEGIGEVALAVGLGAVDGGAFSLVNSHTRQMVGRFLSSRNPEVRARAESTVRGVASSLLGGLPSTFLGAPMESQVFEYLLGAGFGYKDIPYEVKRANQFMHRKSANDLMYVDDLPGFKDLEPTVQSELLFQKSEFQSRIINASGDTSSAGVQARFLTDIYHEEYEKGFEEVRGAGGTQDEADREGHRRAQGLTGIIFKNRQQEVNYGLVGRQLRNALGQDRGGAFPELHIGDIPDAPGRPVHYDKQNDQLFIDEQVLRDEFQKQGEVTDPREFRDRLVLEEFLSKTSAEGVDTSAAVDDIVRDFTYGDSTVEAGVKPDIESTPESVKTEQRRRKGRLTIEEVEQGAVDVTSRTEVTRNAIGTDALLENRDAQNAAREDHEMGSIMIGPLENFANVMKRTIPDMTSYEAKNIVFRAFAKDDATWDTALQNIRENLPEGIDADALLDTTSDEWRSIRRSWKSYKSGVGVRQGHYSGGVLNMYGDAGLGRVDGSGKTISKVKALNHLQRSLDDSRVPGLFIVENNEQAGRYSTRVSPMFEDNRFDFGHYINAAWNQGKPFFAGAKDKGRNVHLEGLLYDKGEMEAIWDEKMAAIAQVEADLGISSGLDDLLKAAETPVLGANDRILHSPIDPVAWRGTLLNNMLFLERINGGIKFEGMIRHNHAKTGNPLKGAFIMTPQDLNKRMQLLDDGSPTADPAFYPQEVQDLGGMKAVVVDDLGFTGEGIDPIRMPIYVDPQKLTDDDRRHILPGRGPKGEVVVNRKMEHHTDGVVFERSDIFDARLEDIGGDPGAGVIKGATVFSDQDQGMFLGKMAIFRAPEGMEAELRRMGLHQVYMGSAAKQTGLRQTYNLHVKKDGSMQFENTATPTHSGINPENVKSFVVPFHAQRMNMSVGENVASAKKDQRAPLQIHTTLEDPQAIQQWMDEVVLPSVNGSTRMNAAVQDYRISRDKDVLNAIDWDEVSLDEILNIYSGANQEVRVDDGLHSAMMKHILNKQKEEPHEIDTGSEFSFEDVEEIRELAEFTSAADRMLSLWDLTPGVISHRTIRPYADAAVRNYAVNRLMKPKIKYSGKVIAGPADPYLRSKMKIEPGKVYLDDSWKDKKIKWIDGKEIPMGKAWKLIQHATGDQKAEMERAFKFATIRVPSDSLSGTRILQFGGFTGRRGAGGTVHNEEMVYLGGMDLDIDSFFIFQSPGGAIEKHFNDNRNQFTDENGVIVDSKPEANDKHYVTQLEDYEKHPLAAIDPRLLMSSSAGAYRGNKLLGIAAVAGRRGSSWYDAAHAGDLSALRVVPTANVLERAKQLVGADATDIRINLEPVQDKREFDLARREAMNRAADAGDFPGFKQDKTTIGSFITKNLVNRIGIEYKDAEGNQKIKILTADVHKEFFTPNKTQLWRGMQDLDSYGNGRNYGQGMSLEKAWDHVRKSFPDIGPTPKDIDGDIEYPAHEAASLIAKQRRDRGNQEIPEALLENVLNTIPQAETKSYTLAQTMAGLKRLGPTVDVNNTFYKGLRELSKARFKNRDNDMSYVNEKTWQNIASSFNKIWMEETPEARTARRLVQREGFSIDEGEIYDTWKLEQDISDIVSARIAYDAAADAIGNHGVLESRLQEISTQVEKLKALNKEALNCG